MLTLRVQKLGDVAIIHCLGRIMFPYASELRGSVFGHLRTRILVLDLLNTVAMDAAGLGVLVSLRECAKHNNCILKLMNVTPGVEQLLQMTKLKSAFEVCSAEEMLDLLCRAIHEHESSRLQPALRDDNAIDGMLDEHSPMLVI